MHRFGAIILCLALASCVTQPSVPNVWVRTDGQTIRESAALVQQYEVDRTVCEGEMQKANLSGTQFCRGVGDCMVSSIERNSSLAIVAKGCMAQKGYVLMPEDQAEAYKETARATAKSSSASAKR